MAPPSLYLHYQPVDLYQECYSHTSWKAAVLSTEQSRILEEQETLKSETVG